MQIRTSRTPLIAGAAIVALIAGGTTPAFASSDPDPDSIARTVAAAAPTDLNALDVEQIGDQLSASFSEGGTAALGVNAAEGLAFSSDAGEAVATVSLPGASGLADAVVSEDGSVTYAGNHEVPSVNVIASEDAVRISTVNIIDSTSRLRL